MGKFLFPAILFAAAASLPVSAQTAAPDEFRDPASGVSKERLRADIDALVGFGTRHTLSEQDNPARGIGAAIDWGARQFRAISSRCDNCLEVVLPERMVSGRRIAAPVRLRNVVAIQRGSERPDEVVIVQGHIDSRVSDVLDWKSDAPGANDDGSGSALVIEAARVLSQNSYPTTIIYALLSGEEQGLYGGKLMADWVAEQGFRVKAVLNNDIVGNSCGSDGYCDADHVRVFSEGPRADLDAKLRAAQRRDGGENDSPGRNLSRWLAALAGEYQSGVQVRQIWRTDRMGRGGDQIPFLQKGYPAARFSVAVENYEHQHQDLRSENGVEYGDTAKFMDFAYLAEVTRLNVRALDRLARAPMPPAPSVKAAVRTSSELHWTPSAGASSYQVYARRTDAPNWPRIPAIEVLAQDEKDKSETVDFTIEFSGLRGDDWIFGVSACAAKSPCGPIASAVPAGGYAPASAPPPVPAREQK